MYVQDLNKKKKEVYKCTVNKYYYKGSVFFYKATIIEQRFATFYA